MAADKKGGFFSEHGAQKRLIARVAPTFTDHHNTLRAPPRPIACFRLEDFRFEFDSSFIKPETAAELVLLARWFQQLCKPAMSVFGHADPVGDDEYNKTLSGRRAQAVYALLVRDTALWDDLYSHPFGGDNWQNIASARAAKQQGFAAYMDSICQDDQGVPFSVTKEDFLGKGADPKGKADYQGCSEFNPVLVFSKAENDELSQPSRRPERNQKNATNRRVLVFLYPPGTRVEPAAWPCPRVKEPSAGCKPQFWPDGDVRRNPQENHRDYVKNRDTFACAFYDSMARGSPCEAPRRLLQIRLFDGLARDIPEAPYRLTIGSVEQRTGVAGKDGMLREDEVLAVRKLKVEWGFKGDTELPFSNTLRMDHGRGSDEETAEKRLTNLGYLLDELADNLRNFKHDYEITPEDGELDAQTKIDLQDIHDKHMTKDEFKAARGK